MGDDEQRDERLDIAVIGMAGRFPRAGSVDELWTNLCAGLECISFFTPEELEAEGLPAALVRRPDYVRALGLVEDADRFDAAFFGVTPREAQIMDPQQRIFLECAWEALEHAGHPPRRHRDGRIAVFAGTSASQHAFRLLAQGGHDPMFVQITNDKDFLATRVAYKLDLRGPAVTVQCACSTSLVAIALAAQSLLTYQTDVALAGGVSLAPKAGYVHQRGSILSPDGHCRAFDARAAGTVGGSGAAIVVLRRLDDAVRDGDFIHAVLKGVAINNDGNDKIGYTAPSLGGQAAVVRDALDLADVDAATIGYVEAHGTGTELGDPIEVAALTEAYRAHTDERGYCALGSLKTNIGHLDAAAGVAGFIKAVLAVREGRIPPTIHFESPNPKLLLESSPFYVSSRLVEWPASSAPRRAGVSSLGIGGTNAHAILEEPPASRPAAPALPAQLLVLSAKSAKALERASERLASRLEAEPTLDLADVAFTLDEGRERFEHRAAVVARSVTEAVEKLRRRPADSFLSGRAGDQAPALAFLFPGQGGQRVRMGRELRRVEPFRAAFDACMDLLRPIVGRDLREVVFARDADVDAARADLVRMDVAQPLVFAVEYALARMLEEWGLRPAAMLGHSMGEYAAATLAGVFTLEAALRLVAARSALMQKLPPGAMTAVLMDEHEVRAVLPAGVSIAAVNAPGQVVVSGPLGAMSELEAKLAERGVEVTRLRMSHASHSPMMDPILDEFARAVAAASPRAPTKPFVSCVTGTWITPEQATDPRYWARHLRDTVRFADGLRALGSASSGWVLLEVGPGGALTSFTLRSRLEHVVAAAPTMTTRQSSGDDLDAALESVGRAWTAGVEVSASSMLGEGRRRVALPTYPFERTRFALPRPTASRASGAEKAARPEDWIYVPSWKRVARAARTSDAGAWIVVDREGGLGAQVAAALEDRGAKVALAVVGETFGRRDDRWTVRLEEPNDYLAVLGELKAAGERIAGAVHLLQAGDAGEDDLERAAREGFFGVAALTRALAAAAPGRATRLVVATSGLCDVLGGEEVSPWRSLSLGVCRVARQEHPEVQVGCVDVGPARSAGAVHDLVAEVLDEAPAPIVAHRGGRRWLESFERVRLASGVAAPWRERGVYVLIGGFGRVGLAIAEHLAKRVRARLVLVGRTALPPRESWPSRAGADDEIARRIDAVARLEALGAEVVASHADISDEASTRAMLEAARARFGEIDGLFFGPAAHVSAPLADDARLRASAVAQFSAKLRGVVVLERVLRDVPVGVCVLHSSLSTIIGGLGFGAYAAANAALDAFATRAAARGAPWRSVVWDAWSAEGPGTSGIGAELRSLALTSEEGGNALDCVMRVPDEPRIVVSTCDLGARIAKWQRFEEPADSAATQDVERARADSAAEEAPAATPTEKAVLAVVRDVLGVQATTSDSFHGLGGDSLAAIRTVHKLSARLERQIPLQLLLSARSLGDIAQRIDALALGGASAEPSPIVLLREGQQPGLFLVNASVEGLGPYSDLVRRLPPGPAVHGISPDAIEFQEWPELTIERLAACYVDGVVRAQPNGPIRIAGWSSGGIVGYELARQLAARGRAVAGVMLFDSFLLRGIVPEQEDLAVWEPFAARYGLPSGSMLATLAGDPLARASSALRATGVSLDAGAEAKLRRDWERFRRFARALERYRPEALDVEVALVKARDNPPGRAPAHPTYGWSDVAVRRLAVHAVPGDHERLMTAPSVIEIAALLADWWRAP